MINLQLIINGTENMGHLWTVKKVFGQSVNIILLQTRLNKKKYLTDDPMSAFAWLRNFLIAMSTLTKLLFGFLAGFFSI
jgi:hypothetical protein